MIDANDIYLIEALKEEGLNDRQIESVLSKLAGWRIYVRAKTLEKQLIKNLYKEKRKQGLAKIDIIKFLASIFNKHEKTIRRIVCEERD